MLTVSTVHGAAPQVLELLNHINKRVKALPSTQLPLLPLVRLALDGSAGPMVRSFALVYVEMAQPRAPPQQQLEAVSERKQQLSIMRVSCHTEVATQFAGAGLRWQPGSPLLEAGHLL